MIKKLLSSVIVVSAMFTFTSCLNSSDDSVTYYEDTAVTAFSLGTLNQYLHTTASDGVSDSTYVVSYSASTYAFYIDQIQKVIYNPDSLPQGTDASKVICSITSKNSGTVVLVLKDQSGSDSLAYYSSTDSIDFSEPLRVRVYNLNGTGYREYVAHVNVHQQSGDEINWVSTSYSALADVSDRKIIYNGTQQYLFGVKGGQTVVYRLNGSAYEQMAQTFEADAYKSVVTMGGYLYVLNNDSVMRSADGQTWEQTGVQAGMTQLFGASASKLYALTSDGIMSSADSGATWTAESLDDDAANLPTDNINFVCMPSKTNEQTYTLILVGLRDGQAKVWRKVEENATGSQSQTWSYYPEDEYNSYALPALANLQVIGYDDGLLAIGGDFSTFYESKDQGITWLTNDDMTLTDSFGKTASPFTMVSDSSNIIYLSKSGSNAVWSGRLARMGWSTNQQAYTE
ncbi:MAG: hypothetical protein I3J02_12045 [Prevotella sp.]|nr:hypothetical protein [Prevotella sp.]